MVQINFARKEINCKLVYYGPGLSGKTTSLEVVHQRTPDGNKGELTSISTDGDRTLFFDFMPLDLGTIAGMKTKFHLYTVPGQVYYNSTRKLVLLGADGVIFVADSSPGRMEDNVQSMENLRENLAEMGRDLNKIPLVIQYNKRDVPGAATIEELEAGLNPQGAPHYEASAKTGEGIFQTLKAISALVLEDINSNEKRVVQGVNPGAARARPAPAAAEPVSATEGSSGLMPERNALRPVSAGTATAAPPQVAAAASAAPAAPAAPMTPVEPMPEAVEPVRASRGTVGESRTALATQIQAAERDDSPPVRGGRSGARSRRRPAGQRGRQAEAKGNGGRLVMFMILGILAGAVAAVAAYKLVIEPGAGS